MNNTYEVIETMQTYLTTAYGHNLTSKIILDAKLICGDLCRENESDSKSIKEHTEFKIYPLIGIYHAMQKHGIEKDEALQFIDNTYSLMAEQEAESIRKILKIPFVYKLMPKVFKYVTLQQFGEKAGFKAKFYNTAKTQCKFDVEKCLYCDVCRKNNCFELTKCFCHTDDVKDGNMHPHIHWNRTKTMGEGGNICDFDITVK